MPGRGVPGAAGCATTAPGAPARRLGGGLEAGGRVVAPAPGDVSLPNSGSPASSQNLRRSSGVIRLPEEVPCLGGILAGEETPFLGRATQKVLLEVDAAKEVLRLGQAVGVKARASPHELLRQATLELGQEVPGAAAVEVLHPTAAPGLGQLPKKGQLRPLAEHVAGQVLPVEGKAWRGHFLPRLETRRYSTFRTAHRGMVTNSPTLGRSWLS